MARRFIVASMFPFSGNFFDSVKESQSADDIAKREEADTGWKRLMRIMQPDEFGGLSEEVETVLQVGCMSMFVGALYGGVIQSRVAYMDFFRNNQATVFKDHLEAKKRLQDRVTLAFGRGALRWGWRLTFFSTTYVAIATGVSVYRNKTGILEYLLAGVVTGVTYKFNMGPRGWIVGGGLGLLLGLMAGGTTVGILKLSGLTMEDTRHLNSAWRNKRADEHRSGVQKHLEKKEMELLLDHNRKIEAAVKGLDPIPTS